LRKIISKLTLKSLFVYGTGKAAVSFIELAKSSDFEIDGFIETSPNRKSFIDLPIFSLEEFDAKEDCLIVVASMFYREIEKEIYKKNISAEILFYIDYIQNNDCFAPCDEQINEIQKIKTILADNESAGVLENIIEYRNTLDRRLLEQIFSPNQYFPSEIKDLIDYSNFYDVGAFNGDTIEAVSKNNVSCKKLLAFEPDIENFRKIDPGKRYDFELTLINKAVGEKDGLMGFNSTSSGYSSSIQNTLSENKVEVVKLDNFVNEKNYPTCLKVDTEGHDLQVLKGSYEVIKRYRPNLMVSIYHSPVHLYQIPSWIKENFPDYQIFVRHHRDSLYETICYAIS
jgi:FkbM family methyltransferase